MSLNLPKKTETINGTDYELTKMVMRDWYVLRAEVFSAFGPPMAELLSGAHGDILGMDLSKMKFSPTGLARAIYQICESLPVDRMEKLVTMMSKQTMVGGQPLDPNVHWPRNMKDMIPWLAAGIQWELGDFLAGVESVQMPTKEAAE